MQRQRLFEIIYILLDKKKVTARELAEHFEVSIRTILRDIETLSMANIPIYTTQGKGGGIGLLDNFILDKTMISKEEQNQILFALQSLSATKHIDINNTLSKLTSLFQKSNTQWIEVDFSRWSSTTTDKQNFEKLKEAIINKVIIQFLYYNAKGESKQRTIYPLKLIFKSRSWYLQGYCTTSQGYRIFKISRMLDIQLLEDYFIDQQFEIPSINDNSPSSLMIDVELKFTPYMAHRVYDEFDINTITQLEDQSFLVQTKIPEDQWLYGLLLSFGTEIEIIKPKHLRDNLKNMIEKILKKYL